jgi:hypothetical protein
MAYRGYFNHQNIPGYLGFIQDYISDRINPEKLVQAAIPKPGGFETDRSAKSI